MMFDGSQTEGWIILPLTDWPEFASWWLLCFGIRALEKKVLNTPLPNSPWCSRSEPMSLFLFGSCVTWKPRGAASASTSPFRNPNICQYPHCWAWFTRLPSHLAPSAYTHQQAPGLIQTLRRQAGMAAGGRGVGGRQRTIMDQHLFSLQGTAEPRAKLIASPVSLGELNNI